MMKLIPKKYILLESATVILLLLSVFIGSSFADSKRYEITRAEVPPIVDGRIDDYSWSQANVTDEFLQNEPDRFSPPTEYTCLKMLYDDEAIFIGVRCYDSHPEFIHAPIQRRDESPPADYVAVFFDSRNDNQTAFYFKVNAGGLMRDIYYYNDGNWSDDSWDAVWEAETTIDDSGWVAEMRIPYTSLRFPPAKEQVWGMNVVRNIHHKNEEDRWVVHPREENGYVSKFGDLVGIRDIPQPFNLEVLPYINTKYENTDDKTGMTSGAGANIKYSLSSSVILDAAFNPDFGQIEADPSVLNLGVFETYYPEKRPFFLEGATLFDTPYTLFYSRRIGHQPCYYDLNDDEEMIEQPDNTTILSAFKITGKNADGISFGILEVVTDREYGSVENDTGEKYDRIIEPYSNFLVGRLKKDVLAGNSSIGIMTTALNRENGIGAYSGGFDWNLYFHGNDYTLSGQAVASDRGDPDEDRESGYAVNIDLEKMGGKHHGFEIDLEAKSPDFNISDMGYMERDDEIDYDAGYYYVTREPAGKFRQTWSGISTWQGYNYNGDYIENGFGPWFNFQWMNYWWTNFGCHYNFERFNDTDTRGGPVMRPPANYGYWFWGSTDQNKSFYLDTNFWGGESTSKSWWGGAYLQGTFRPFSRLEASLLIQYERMFDENQWVDNIDDDADSTHYVFGRLDNRTWKLTARLSYNFNRDMSLQFYAQPFITVGKYGEYIELAAPRTYTFKPYNYVDENGNPESADFNVKELNMNLVYRWEYAPGSAIFLVWNRGMYDDLNEGRYDMNNNIADLANAKGNDIFMLKINKWFDF